MTIRSTQIPVEWVHENQRLDASYYAQDGIEARVVLDELEDAGIEMRTIGKTTEKLFKESRFKRNYTEEREGEPYLTPTDMFTFPFKPRKRVKNPPNGLKASPGWIIITRSRTVGRTIISNEFLSDFILSDDLIRVVPEGEFDGYLYAYLNTWVGQALLTKDEFGATVKHIDPHQVEKIRLPRLDIEEEISEQIKTAHQKRTEAHARLQDAQNRLNEALNLKTIPEEKSLFDSADSARSFSISARNLEHRLDASYHTPRVHAAIESMQNSADEGYGEINRLAELADSFVPPRFTRIYVENSEHGIPMLQGSHIDQIKPQGLQHIWKEMDNIERYLLEEGMILVTCSGTVGDLCLVSEHQSGWAATNHLIRIIPNSGIHPGYLTAFLMSDYGQIQFERLTYGGVVDEIGESGELVEDLRIFTPSDESIEHTIGDTVNEAYKKRDEANEIENKAVEKLEQRFETIADMQRTAAIDD